MLERDPAVDGGPARGDGVAEGARSWSPSRDTLYRRLLAIADVIAAAGALYLDAVVVGDDQLNHVALAVIPIVVLVSKAVGLYDRDELVLHKGTLEEAPALFRVATFYTFVVWLTEDFMIGAFFGQDQLLVLWALLFAGMLLARSAARRVSRALAPEERCLVVGDAAAGEWVRRKLETSPTVKAHVAGRVALEEEQEAPGDATDADGSVPRLGRLDALERIVGEERIDRVIVAPTGTGGAEMLRVVRLVKALGVKVSVLPRLLEVVGSSAEFDELDGLTLLGLRRHGLSRSSRALKRAVDVTGAALGLVLFAPLLGMIALAIKLDTPGPILFRQRRMGRGDTVFEMLKFRTMVRDADQRKAELMSRNEAQGLFKIADDPRITRVGRCLRRTSLDELPQLINVLRGEMSLVGPRPLVIEEDAQVEGWQRRRLLVRPGITGLWQIFGSARIPLDEMVKIDYLYGANWSLWLDLKILLRTMPYVASRRGL